MENRCSLSGEMFENSSFIRICLVLLPILFLLVGCGQEPTATERSSTQSSTSESRAIPTSSSDRSIPFLTKNITGLNGVVYQLSLPSNWIEEVDPASRNKDFQFMVSDEKQEEFIGCITENKEDFADIEAYTKLATKGLEENTGTKIGFLNERINGKQIQVAEFSAVVDGVKVSYIYHIIETKTAYVQLYGWTYTRLFEESQDRLKTILNSFEET